MRVSNMNKWREARPSDGSGTQLPAGGYVLRIVGVEDVPEKEYINIVYDVAEGDHRGVYAGMGPDDDWKHRFVLSYKETAFGIFKGFLKRLEESNPSFSAERWEETMDEHAFIGKLVGASWGTEKYLNNEGKERTRTTMPYWYSADAIRSGDFKCPKDVDNTQGGSKKQTKTVVTTAGDVYDDCPF